MKIGRRKLAAVMFTDIVGYSALTHRNENLALRLVEEHRGLLRPLFTEHRGREIRTIGDAFFVEFASALDAVECGIQIQKLLVGRNARAGGPSIELRIGIHMGDVVEAQDDVYDIYGDGVNIAARLQFLAKPNGIAFSRQVYDQVRNQIPEFAVSAGARKLKNISRRVEVYRIDFAGAANRTDFVRRAATSPGFLLRFLGNNLLRGARAPVTAFVGVTILAALATLGVLQKSGFHRADDSSAVNAQGNRLRIAILPFSHRTGDASNEYLSEGLTDELITSLSRLPQLGVLARASVSTYRDSQKPLHLIGQELNVNAILSGQVKKSANGLRVSVQLVDVRSQENLWADSFDTPVDGVFELQKKIAGLVVDQVRTRSLASVPGTTLPRIAPDKEAYLHYLKGRYFLNRRSEDSLRKAFDQFGRAIEKDPGYPGHFVGATTALHLLAYYGYISPQEALSRERPYSQKALDLSRESAEVITARASRRVYYDHDWPGAESDFRKALDLQPTYPNARQSYGMFLLSQGRFEDARHEFNASLELDPLSPTLLVSRAFPDFFQGNYDAAIKQIKAALDLDPEFAPAHLWMARALMFKGEYAKAIQILETVRKLSGGAPVALGALGYAYAKAGKIIEARKVLKGLNELAGNRYVSAYNLALVELGLGNHPAALKLLSKAFDERSVLLVDLRIDPFLAPLRGEARFRDLLTAMNF